VTREDLLKLLNAVPKDLTTFSIKLHMWRDNLVNGYEKELDVVEQTMLYLTLLHMIQSLKDQTAKLYAQATAQQWMQYCELLDTHGYKDNLPPIDLIQAADKVVTYFNKYSARFKPRDLDIAIKKTRDIYRGQLA